MGIKNKIVSTECSPFLSKAYSIVLSLNQLENLNSTNPLILIFRLEYYSQLKESFFFLIIIYRFGSFV